MDKMTVTAWHIPDPEAQPEFYSDVPTKRLIAWVIDTAVTLLLCVVALPFTAFTGLFFFPALFLTIGFFYRLATITQGSATLGMRLTSIEFRRLSGELFDGPFALWHSLSYTVSCIFFPLQLASMAMMLTTSRGQGLTDSLLGTVVLNRRAAM